MNWKLDPSREAIFFNVFFSSGLANVLVGFSDHGFPEGTDFCIFRVVKGEMVVKIVIKII